MREREGRGVWKIRGKPGKAGKSASAELFEFVMGTRKWSTTYRRRIPNPLRFNQQNEAEGWKFMGEITLYTKIK